jgi:hypothetical protein
MEVHHSHNATHHKKWTGYLLEFFMLFLAVTLGFFAENLRERFSEHQRAKEYAGLLVDDFTTDIHELNRTSYILTRIINYGDSLAALINNGNINKSQGGKLYYYEYWSSWRWKVTPRDATLKQLENSGALRYLGNTALIRKILDYEEVLKIITLLEDNIAPEKATNWQLVQRVFNTAYFDTLANIKAARLDSTSNVSQTDANLLDSFLTGEYPLMIYDKNTLMELSNWARTSSRGYFALLETIHAAKQKAAEAIDALKKKYHLK